MEKLKITLTADDGRKKTLRFNFPKGYTEDDMIRATTSPGFEEAVNNSNINTRVSVYRFCLKHSYRNNLPVCEKWKECPLNVRVDKLAGTVYVKNECLKE